VGRVASGEPSRTGCPPDGLRCRPRTVRRRVCRLVRTGRSDQSVRGGRPGTRPFESNAIADVYAAGCRGPAAYSSLSATYYGSKEEALEAVNPRRVPRVDPRPSRPLRHRERPAGDRRGRPRRQLPRERARLRKAVRPHAALCWTFELPDAYVAGDPDVAIDTRDDQSIGDLADAKGVPAEWGRRPFGRRFRGNTCGGCSVTARASRFRFRRRNSAR